MADYSSERYEAFKKECFYYDNGKPRRVFKEKPDDIVYCRITGDHGYAHEWWKDYDGLIIAAKPVFHKTNRNWQFLYEVLPIISRKRYQAEDEYLQGRSIIASCIRIIDPFTSNKTSNKSGQNHIIL